MGSTTWRIDGSQISDGCETGEDGGYTGICSPLMIIMTLIIVIRHISTLEVRLDCTSL